MRISDWSSDVCSSDLAVGVPAGAQGPDRRALGQDRPAAHLAVVGLGHGLQGRLGAATRLHICAGADRTAFRCRRRASGPAPAARLSAGGAGGKAVYALLVIPHYWHWDTLPGRDFSTLERVLTQPRVLCLYL